MTTDAHAMVRLAGVTKRYGDFPALHPVDLAIRKGEFVTLLGPSGSGKSTILNLIAGMTQPSAGQVFIDGRDATHLPTNKRGLGMVFQNYALMPHMTVYENVAFPLQVRRVPKAEIRRRVMRALELIQLSHAAARRPRELSGGQQQRVSLARCLVYDPSLILMDEPLGALDKNLREQMQLEIKRLHAELGVTMLYVTHDQDEALTMSDRIVLMRDGRIEQQGDPAELYFEPDTVFCAEFIGASNILAGTLETGGTGAVLRVPAGPVRVGPVPATLAEGGPAALLVRPENIALLPPGDPAARLSAELQDTIVMGGVVRHFVRCADGSLLTVQELNRPGTERPARGDAVHLGWSQAHARLLPPRAA